MIRNSLVPVAIATVALVSLAGCTGSGSTRHPASPGVGSPSSASVPGTATGTAPTAPTRSATATCSASATTLTFRRHTTVVAGEEYGLSPGGRKTTPFHLPVITAVRATAPGLGTGSGLTRAVGKHWHTIPSALGTSTASRDETRVGLHDSSRHNESYVVYRFVHVFTGKYASRCGGSAVSGSYTTFGPLTTVVVK